MANYAPYPVLRFYDNSNNPLVGGKVFTYLAGTTTPVTTYQDVAGTTPNSNPIILDSRGEAIICLTEGVAHKFLLKTSADVTIRTTDNITVSAYPTAAGNSIIAAADASAQRVLLGFNSTAPSTAGKDLITAPNAIAQRTLLGITTNSYNKNLIINSGFNVTNRYYMTTNNNIYTPNAAGGSFYFCDGWIIDYGSGSNPSSYITLVNAYIYQSGFQMSSLLKSDADLYIDFPTSMSTASYVSLKQRIEGPLSVVSDGTKKITVSFNYLGFGSSNTINVKLTQNFGSGGSPSSSVTITGTPVSIISGVTTAYAFTVTLPSTFGKSWGTNRNSSYLELQILFPLPTAGSSSSNRITNVQLEVGDVATPFEYRTPAQDLILCQRYFYRFYQLPIGYAVDATRPSSVINHKVSMRAIPTLEAGAIFNVSSGNSGTPSLLTNSMATTTEVSRVYNSGAGWTTGVDVGISSGLSAEL